MYSRSDLFGSPGSLPASIDAPQPLKRQEVMDNVYGIDGVAMQYKLEKLSKMVNLYHHQCEQLKKRLSNVEREASSNFENIRTFYRNMPYYFTFLGVVGQCVCALSSGSGCACFKSFGTFCMIVHFTIIDHIKIIQLIQRL